MSLIKMTKTGLAIALSAQLLVATQGATMAQAQMIGTAEAARSHGAMADRQALLDAMQMAEVRAEMLEMGVDPAEAEMRLAAMTDAEVAAFADQVEAQMAGASLAGTIGVVFVVLLITDLLCFTRLFTFIRCVR